jgi:pyruvate,water dikinase
MGGLVLRPVFDRLLATAHELAARRDTMHFEWTGAFPLLRAIIQELSQRWVAAGLLASNADAYCLTLSDMHAIAARPRPMQDEIARRRRSWERDRRRQWPLEVVAGREVYDDAPDALSSGDEELRGVAGSPGVASGTVRVIAGPHEFRSLKPGEVLVAPVTNPAWTPLFAVAGALVAETGGVLSHGAIVAREYGIPAVMGVRGATQLLRDGDVVTVDGTRGTVRPAVATGSRPSS